MNGIDFVCGLDRLNDLIWEAEEKAVEWANGECYLTKVQLNHLAHIYGASRFPYMALEKVHSAQVGKDSPVFSLRIYKGITRRQIDSVGYALTKLARKIREEA